MSSGPIFIGGLAHTGKTQLRLMLCRQPRIRILRGTHLWDRIYGQFGELDQPENFKACLAAIRQLKFIRQLQPDIDHISRQFLQGPMTYAQLFALIYQQYAEQVGKPRWGEQLGFVERFVDPIFSAYPDAKMIHMVRDPRDRFKASSNLMRQRQGKLGWATARWIYSARLVQRNCQRYPDRYKVVQYEKLLGQPQTTLREICSFLNEPFVPEMLSHDEVKKILAGAQKGNNGLESAAVDTPSSLFQRANAFTQSYARPYMLALNYPLRSAQLSLPNRLRFYLIDWPANRASMAFWNAFRARSLGQYLEK